MSWKINSIGIYSTTGELERIDFRTNGLNIITGTSARGKSTILDIVDYCLLPKSCPVSKGVVRNSVSSVALLLKRGRERAAITRPFPPVGQKASGMVSVRIGPGTDLPQKAPEFDWNLDSAREALAEFTGIEALPILTNYDSVDPDARHAAGIRHCVPYLFQPQDVIASRNVAFPRLDDTWQRNHVIDALPYFLGILSAEALAARRTLRELRLERNQLARELQLALSTESGSADLTHDLWHQAHALGLADGYEGQLTIQEMVRAMNAIVRNPTPSTVPISDAAERELEAAERDEAALTGQVTDARRELHSIHHALAMTDGLREIHELQLGRLKLRDLLPTSESKSCPLCGNGTISANEIEAALTNAGQHVSDSEEISNQRLRSRIELEMSSLEAKIRDLDKRLRSARRRVVMAMEAIGDRRKVHETAARRSELIGRIRMLVALRSTPKDPIRERLEQLDVQIRELNNVISDYAIQKEQGEVEREIGERMSEVAEMLDVEFPGAPCRLKLSELRIEVKVDGETYAPLSELGSGANWVGYHVAACVSLHEYLQRRKRPVPHILLLDQPSQAWFPQVGGQPDDQKIAPTDPATRAVHRVYEVLRDIASSTNGPQIIALDHAKFDDPWFRDATIRDWHGHDGLVPDSWR